MTIRKTLWLFLLLPALSRANDKVHVSRFWHVHQPLYWPEWNTNGSQTQRAEYAWDSISLKFARSYPGSASNHPENNLGDIFGKDDRRNAYQSGPRDSLATFDTRGGFAMSYSGSLIDNVRQLGGGGHLGYGAGWNLANREARGWTTPAGGPRMDLVGFTYHHSLAPLLPKEVLRKELRIFKQAWWKAWGGESDLSDHSKGFFPTEMAYSRHIVGVLVEEGYEWVIVPSHHISRTSPSYLDQFDLQAGQYGVFSSPPNRADLLGPVSDTGWWYGQPNPGNAAWNLAPTAYQLHKVEYVDPVTGAVKHMIAVPSDDVLSYRYGYADEGIAKIGQYISPFATNPARPVLVMPATDGDNAWGGGSSSWFEATPRFFNDSAASGYIPTTPQDFVDAHGAAAPLAHIEDGAWIFPESDYGSPYFLKWIEPPVAAPGSGSVVPGTIVDMETPGFALKFWSWAPVVTGANWVQTAEQILRDEGGSVEDWKIQAPYDWDGTWTGANEVELAWHIYLKGLDSGFNYYGGLGNDDEVKPALAATRAIQKLQPWMTGTRRANDRTAPTVLKPQRFPYNPGGFTFGWFNSVPGGDTNYLKRMPSDFYVWTHAYDLSGIDRVTLKIRLDDDGLNDLHTHVNELYAGGAGVGGWIDIPMTKRTLPNDQASLNAAADNGQINYFITPPELADYYFAHVTDAAVAGFRGRLLDYYIEAEDALGNVHASDIQHVFVEDDGGDPVDPPPPSPGFDLGAAEEPAGYRVAEAGMRLFAAVRGDLLYVATWTPSGGGNDHFVFVSADAVEDTPSVPAPWGKTGHTAHPGSMPYLAAEADNTYIGWFNTGDTGTSWRDADTGGRMEGVIDLAEVFGAVPERIFLAAAAYSTADGGTLAAQSPAGNGDGDLGPSEFMEFPVAALRDSAANGVFDRLDPARGFRIDTFALRPSGPELTLPVVPGREYRVLTSTNLLENVWTPLFLHRANSGDDTVTLRHESPGFSDQLYYRLELTE